MGLIPTVVSGLGAGPILTAVLLILFFATAAIVPGAITWGSALLAILALILGWRGLRDLERDEWLVLAGFAAYVAGGLLSLFNNSDWDTAAWRFEKYHPFLLAFPILGLLRTLRPVMTPLLLTGLLLASVGMVALALWQQIFLHYPRVGLGTGLNPNIFGYLAGLVALVLLMAGLALKQHWSARAGWILGAAVALYAAFATGSRGVLLAFLGAVVATAVLWLLHNRRKPVEMLYSLGVVLLLLAAVLWGMSHSEFWQAHWQRLLDEPQRFLDGDYQYTSVAARATMLLAAWQIWLSNPWLGTGLGDAQNDFDVLMAAGELPQVAGASNHIFHNIFADALATTGLIGTLLMLVAQFALPAWFFWLKLRSAERGSAASFAALAGLAVVLSNFLFGLTNSWLYLRSLPFVLIVMLMLMVIASPGFSPGRSSSSS